MNEILPSVVIDSAPHPNACVIWLHGLGADGHDFEPVVPELRLPPSLPVRFIFPHAPQRPVTINQGCVMRAWYDITHPDLGRFVDAAGIHQSRQLIDKLVNQVVGEGIAPGRIILAGFSQGGVIALETGLRHDPPIGGIIALSTYVALPDELPGAKPESPPILMMHGSEDPLIPLPLAEAGRDLLLNKGYQVAWHVFPMPHSVCAEEIAVIRRWLLERLA